MNAIVRQFERGFSLSRCVIPRTICCPRLLLLVNQRLEYLLLTIAGLLAAIRSTAKPVTIRLKQMAFFYSARIIRCVLALALILWVSGAGCMFACGNMVQAAEHASASTLANVVVSGDACASAHSHDCCASHGAKASTSSKKAKAPTSVALATGMSGATSTMESCPLAVNATAALSKARADQSIDALVAARSELLNSRIAEQPIALSVPSLLPNRGHTYLRCCVFLI